ncbi:MAG: signal peptide peptidase SppA [Actinomycetota bacterium]|nr:signal peptide peptidase SppA [Actinomycetota bacterium]
MTSVDTCSVSDERARSGPNRRVQIRVLAVAATCAAIAALVTGCISVQLGGLGRSELEETTVRGRSGPKILLLEIDGVITEHERIGLFDGTRESTVARVVEQLDRARDDDDVRAVLLRVDSPGGSASASDDVYRALLAFKQERGLPMVAQFMGLAASGGYYVAMASDEIRAVPTSVTGSIGVLFMGISFEGLMDKLGVTDQTVTGGEHKDAGSFLRDMTPEEQAHMQSVVDDLHDRFKAVVAAGRPKLDEEAIAAAADGRVYSAPQALELGLIDGISPIEDTTRDLARMAGIGEKYRVVSYHRAHEYRNNLHTREPQAPPQTSAASQGDWSALLDASGLTQPGFHYLWWPAAR